MSEEKQDVEVNEQKVTVTIKKKKKEQSKPDVGVEKPPRY